MVSFIGTLFLLFGKPANACKVKVSAQLESMIGITGVLKTSGVKLIVNREMVFGVKMGVIFDIVGEGVILPCHKMASLGQ